MLFIADARGSKLVDLSSDPRPQMVLTFGGKFAHREAETVDVAELIAKKGILAKGKKCSPYDLKTVEFGEPLPYDDASEDDTPAEITDLPDLADLPDAPEPEITGNDDEPVDFESWEPTLF